VSEDGVLDSSGAADGSGVSAVINRRTWQRPAVIM
jgi:hypothetical protein